MPPMRSGMHDAKSLGNIAVRLSKAADRLTTLIGAMRDQQLEDLEIFYHTEALRGIGNIEKFTENGFDQLDVARELRGDYGRPGQGKGGLPANGQKLPAEMSGTAEKGSGKSGRKRAKNH